MPQMSEYPQITTGEGAQAVEAVTVTLLNTRFGDALKHPDTLRQLLPAIGDIGRFSIVGATEVTPGVRNEVIAAIHEHDSAYEVAEPTGNGNNIDTLWIYDPRLKIDPAGHHAHPFIGHMASRVGKRQKRDAGRQAEVFITPGGHTLGVGVERLAPRMRGKKARRLHLAHLGIMLDEYAPPDLAINIDLEGGDQNHPNGPEDADLALWEPRGYTRGLEDGTSTYNLDGASRTNKAANRIARMLGREYSLQFDEVYLRAGPDRELIPWKEDTSSVLEPNQIAQSTSILSTHGSDHDRVQTILRFPLVPHRAAP